jgi:transposase
MLTMSRTGARLPVEQKVLLVLAVLGGEMTMAEAARRHGTSAQAIGQWRDRFIEGGKASLENRLPGGPGRAGTQTERRLQAEAEQLKLALAEATVQLRIWRVGAEHVDAVPSQTSKP